MWIALRKSWGLQRLSLGTIMRTFALRLWQHVIGLAKNCRRLVFDVLPSKTNFVLVKPHGVTAGQLFDYLQSKKNLCPLFSKSGAYFRQTTHFYWDAG